MRHVPGTPWDRATMLDMLDRSNTAVERALLVLYARQTSDEREIGATTVHNGMGFGAFDAEILSSFAKQVSRNKYNRREGQRLTEKQMDICRKKIRKYVGQLVEVANRRLEEREEVEHASEVYETLVCATCAGRGMIGVRGEGNIPDLRPCPRCNPEGV